MQNERKPQIVLRDVSKKFGNHRVLENINLDICQGEFVNRRKYKISFSSFKKKGGISS